MGVKQKKPNRNFTDDLRDVSGKDLGDLAEKEITDNIFSGPRRKCKITSKASKRSLRKSSQFASAVIITPDWTSLDEFSPFYNPSDDKYHVTVATKYETLGNEAPKIYAEAKDTGVHSLVDVYNKAANSSDIRKLISLADTPDYFVPLRPNPKCGPNGETIPLFGVKVLVTVPAAEFDKLPIIQGINNGPVPFAEKEINLITSEVRQKIKTTATTLRNYQKEAEDSGNSIRGVVLDKEADRLEEFLFVLENLLAANGIVLRDDRDDLIIVGIDDKDKVLYVLYDDGEEFSSLQAGFRTFLKTKSVGNDRTIRLLQSMGKLQGHGRPQYPVTDFLRDLDHKGGTIGLSFDKDVFDFALRRAQNKKSIADKEAVKSLEDFVRVSNSKPVKTDEEKEDEDRYVANAKLVDAHQSSDAGFLSIKTDFVADATLAAPSMKSIKDKLKSLDDLFENFFHRVNLCKILQVAIDCLKVPERACRIGKAWLISANCEDFLDFFSGSLAMRLIDIPALERVIRARIMSCLANLEADDRNFLLARIQFKSGIEVKSIRDLQKITIDVIIDALGSRGRKFLEEICDDPAARREIVNAVPDDICSALNQELSDIVKKCEFPTIKLPDFFPTIDIIASISTSIEIAITDAILVALLELIKSMIDQILNCEDGFKAPNFGALNMADLLAKTFDINVQNDSFISLETDFLGGLALKAGVFGAEALGGAVRGFIDDLSSLVAPNELAALLNGDADDEVIRLASCLIETKYQGLSALNNPAKLEDFFKTMGDTLDKGPLLAAIAQLNQPEINSSGEICVLPEDQNFRRLLANKGLTAEEIDKQVKAARDRKAETFDKLVAALLSGNPLENVLPPIFCTTGPDGKTAGLVSKMHPSFTFMLDKTINMVYDGVHMSFNNEIKGFAPGLKETTTVQVPRAIPRKIKIGITVDGEPTEEEVENPEFRRLISQGVSVEDPEDLDGDPVIVYEDLTFGTGFAANGLKQNLTNMQSDRNLFNVTNGRTTLTIANAIDTTEVFKKSFALSNDAIANIPDAGAREALERLRRIQPTATKVAIHSIEYQNSIVPREGKDDCTISITVRDGQNRPIGETEQIQINADINPEVLKFIQDSQLVKDQPGRFGVGTPLPQAYFGSYIAKVWKEGAPIYRGGLLAPKPTYAQGVSTPTTARIIDSSLRDEFKTNRHQNLFIDTFSSFAKQVSKSPLFNMKVISLLDFTPDVVPGECAPHLLDLDELKKKMKKAMEEAACVEDLFPSSNGLGKANPNSMEREGINGAIRTFVRLIVIENILRSMFVFSEFRITNAGEVDNAIKGFIADRVLRELENVGTITRDPVFAGQFVEQTLISYNQLVEQGDTEGVGTEKTDQFSVAISFFVNEQINSVTDTITNLFKRKGTGNNDVHLEPMLVNNYIPLFDVQPTPTLNDDVSLVHKNHLAKSEVRRFQTSVLGLFEALRGEQATVAANINTTNAFQPNTLTKFNLDNGNFVFERYVRVKYINEDDRLNRRIREVEAIQTEGINARRPALPRGGQGPRIQLNDAQKEAIKQQIIRSEFGVLNLEDFNKLLRDVIKPELEAMGRTGIPDYAGELPEYARRGIGDIMESIHYGLRLVYVPPLPLSSFENPTPTDEIMNRVLASSNQKFKDAVAFDKAYGIQETIQENVKEIKFAEGDDTSTRIIKEKKHIVEGDIKSETTKNRIIHEFPLVCVEVAENLNNLPTDSAIATVDGVRAWQNVSTQLKDAFMATKEFKFLFKYCFPIDRMFTLLTIYNVVYMSSLPKIQNLFNGTKIGLKSVFQALLNSGNYRYEDQFTNDQMGGNIGISTNALNNENTNPDIPGTSVAAMALRTPFLILKGLVELVDPNISIARKIVDAAKANDTNIPIIAASLGLLPMNVFPPPPMGPGIGPPITPLGFIYLALNIDDIFDAAKGKDTKRQGLSAEVGIDFGALKGRGCSDGGTT